MMTNLLEVKNLVKSFPVAGGFFAKSLFKVHAVNGVSFNLVKGETLGIVGESGCGKTTLALLLMRLLKPDSGQIIFDEVDIATLSEKKIRLLRPRMQMVFQDPYASLNPRMQASEIVEEPLIIHKMGNSNERGRHVLELFDMVGLSSGDFGKYPHEFSGGQRQRIGIARALALKPDLIVADEPVSALDVSIQGEIINLLKNLQKELNLTTLFISHDLKVVSQISHRIVVMYLGEIVETFRAEALAQVQHPYTQALLLSVPLPDPTRKRPAKALEGDVPSSIKLPSGCPFHPRCLYREALCFETKPALISHETDPNHLASCHFTDKVLKNIPIE